MAIAPSLGLKVCPTGRYPDQASRYVRHSGPWISSCAVDYSVSRGSGAERTEAMKITDPHQIDRTALFLEIGGPAIAHRAIFTQGLAGEVRSSGSPAAEQNEQDEQSPRVQDAVSEHCIAKTVSIVFMHH